LAGWNESVGAPKRSSVNQGLRMPVSSEPHELRAGSEDWLLSRLPNEIHARLTPVIKEALAEAVAPRPWGKHPVDIRVSIPLPFGRYYLALVLGPERRNDERRREDGESRRIMTPANVLFILTIVVMFYGVLGIAALLLTRIIE
jgi:hypothetical protein